MNISVSIHVAPKEEIKISEHHHSGDKFIVADIGAASIFIYSRAKALEIASLLESAAQKWGDEKLLDEEQ